MTRLASGLGYHHRVIDDGRGGPGGGHRRYLYVPAAGDLDPAGDSESESDRGLPVRRDVTVQSPESRVTATVARLAVPPGHQAESGLTRTEARSR